MSFDAFFDALLLLIFLAFVVERSLAAVFETGLYISLYGSNKTLKTIIAIIYSVLFVAFLDINLLRMISPIHDAGALNTIKYDWSDKSLYVRNLAVIFFTGLFVAGGSKASLKLFKDVLNIKSGAEARRESNLVAVPKNNSDAALAMANGDKEQEQAIINSFDKFFKNRQAEN